MEKGEMYFRIIEEVYVREDNSAKYSLSHGSPQTKQSFLFKRFWGPKICQRFTF